MKAGYQVLYYENFNHYENVKKKKDNPKVLHEPNPFGQKLTAGTLKQSSETIDTFEFTISISHSFYNDLTLLTGLVEIVNIFDGESEFLGRLLSQSAQITSIDGIAKEYICEDILGYLHDSVQTFKKYPNEGLKQFFYDVIQFHNSQSEAHKHFIPRKVTVESTSDIPYRYTSYDDTFETIKTYMLERSGGFIVVDRQYPNVYIDWLSEIGEVVDTPIQIGKNVVSAQKTINPEEIVTRLIPVGADKDNAVDREEETGQYITRERVTIESVNNGKRYIDDPQLISEFGIIQKSVDWTEISSPQVLKSRGQQFMKNQQLALSSWEVETVELSLIDSRFKKYKVGNKHPIDVPVISGKEVLQIVGKEVDILNPQFVRLKIGESGQTLSTYQLQQQEARKSMQRVIANEASARREAEAKLLQAQQELLESQTKLQEDLTLVSKNTTKESLEILLKQKQSELVTEKSSLSILQSQLVKLNAEGETSGMIDVLNVQIEASKSRISNYNLIIEEIKSKLDILEGGADGAV